MHARAEIGRRFSVLVAIVAVNLLGIGAAHAQNVAPVISSGGLASICCCVAPGPAGPEGAVLSTRTVTVWMPG